MMLGPFRDASGVALTLPRKTPGVVRAILAPPKGERVDRAEA